MKNLIIYCAVLVLSLAFLSCEKSDSRPPLLQQPVLLDLSLENVAKIISSLPIGADQMAEVYGAVNSSSSDGYDEEYTMLQLLENPGSGVGETKASLNEGAVPMKDLLAQYFANNISTKGGARDVEECLKQLSESDLQIYWPYSEDWDGETLPLVTYDPGYEIRSNYAYELRMTEDGLKVVDSVYVDESVAQQRPVWVINNNSDASFTPLEPISLYAEQEAKDSQGSKSLYLKSLCALRNYDSWFAGGSEFFLKAGSVDGIKVTENDQLTNYYPQLNDMMIVVKRSEINTVKNINTLLISGFDDYQDKIALMMTEDDGGTRTTWKCNATVKIKSKSYGAEIEFPFNSRDDIIWRGQIDADYFRKTAVTSGRFGDVKLTFELR